VWKSRESTGSDHIASDGEVQGARHTACGRATSARHNERIASSPVFDIVIAGAGAAGLATAIFRRRIDAAARVVLLEGARRPGAKILVSGGGRCNVTNAQVTERDFNGGSPASIRQVLRSLSVSDTVAFFRDIGVRLHEEERGKLFPDSNRARDVLDALLGESTRLGVERLDGHRVLSIERADEGFGIETVAGSVRARRVVLATGGQSLPKSGSDGSGFELARRLGHTLVPPVPALVPLLLADDGAPPHERLSGVSHDAEIAVWVEKRVTVRIRGPLLWTHFGISGPAALDVSRHWTRAMQERRDVRLTLNIRPGLTFDTVDAELRSLFEQRSRATLQTALGGLMPVALAAAMLDVAGIDGATTCGVVSRESRRALTHALVATPLAVVGTRGYNYAEATAGGVTLSEINPRTMESRVCPGLFLVGEVLDVDGRLGGFNFQWAWSSAMTAARGLA
jgi:predicted Rossmann fold flavoprotein